ncbi:MAG: MoxR family ATPase [Lachnospiraceae bacterium]|nr:MoxR family ATPase [Lachnospiraceae bacterium]
MTRRFTQYGTCDKGEGYVGKTKETFQGSSGYVASPELLSAVNIAMTLEKPLLLKGEPGTGKTMLAQSVADSLNAKLFIWNIKSTTKAQDGLYVYDVVQRLYDSQFGGKNVDNIEQYVHLGQVGEAFESEERCILLIDEIDKADLEFPNDLLWELDQMEFTIPQTGRVVKANHRPVIIITSNAEKELPDAFLRRCIFHYIDFPDEDLMRRIIAVHYPDLERNLLDQAIAAFYWVRSLPSIQKKPSTSELIDWIRALTYSGIPYKKIMEEIPFAGVLLKKNEDLDQLEKAKGRRRF